MLYVLIALAVFVVFVAYKNNWNPESTIAAIGASAVAAWEFVSGFFG
jgi:hypothetical protein